MKRLMALAFLTFVFASDVVADLISVSIDAAEPSAAFRKTFRILVKKDADQRIITLSHTSRPEHRATKNYADGTKIESRTEGVVDLAQIVLHNRRGKRILTAPLHFERGPDRRTSTVIRLEKRLLLQLKIFLYVPSMFDGLCYEIHFRNVK